MEDQNPWRKAYIGSARVRCASLVHAESPEASLDSAKLKRLINIFALSGCQRLDENHRIRVLLTEDEHRKLTHIISPQSLSEPALPLIDLGDGRLTYLHGRHRLAACQSVMPPWDQWWGVDFYLRSKISNRLQIEHLVHFDNTQPYNDGVIFREICAWSRDNSERRKLWLSRLAPNPSKLRDLQQLLRQPRQSSLLEAFVSLFPLDGLWQDFRIGTFHRILTMHCTEELTHYLRHLRQTWIHLLGGASTDAYVDAATVRSLQGRSPRYSLSDRAHIKQSIDDRKAFCWITDEDQRRGVLERCCKLEHTIPSIRTFLEDTKWLEPGSKIVRRLFPLKSSNSIRRTLNACYAGPEAQHGQGFAESYRALWLYALKYFPELDSLRPRQESRKSSTLQLRSSGEAWGEFIRLAGSLHFQAPVTNLADLQQTTERAAANRAPPLTVPIQLHPKLAIPFHQDFDIKHRCGRVFELAYKANQVNLSLENIYRTFTDADAGSHITPFAISRDTFRAFFGFQRHCTLEVLVDPEDYILPSLQNNEVYHGTQIPTEPSQSQSNNEPGEDQEMADQEQHLQSREAPPPPTTQTTQFQYLGAFQNTSMHQGPAETDNQFREDPSRGQEMANQVQQLQPCEAPLPPVTETTQFQEFGAFQSTSTSDPPAETDTLSRDDPGDHQEMVNQVEQLQSYEAPPPLASGISQRPPTEVETPHGVISQVASGMSQPARQDDSSIIGRTEASEDVLPESLSYVDSDEQRIGLAGSYYHQNDTDNLFEGENSDDESQELSAHTKKGRLIITDQTKTMQQTVIAEKVRSVEQMTAVATSAQSTITEQPAVAARPAAAGLRTQTRIGTKRSSILIDKSSHPKAPRRDVRSETPLQMLIVGLHAVYVQSKKDLGIENILIENLGRTRMDEDYRVYFYGRCDIAFDSVKHHVASLIRQGRQIYQVTVKVLGAGEWLTLSPLLQIDSARLFTVYYAHAPGLPLTVTGLLPSKQSTRGALDFEVFPWDEELGEWKLDPEVGREWARKVRARERKRSSTQTTAAPSPPIPSDTEESEL
ncbi:hypothetical protein CLCR_09503 [Cladophialophora carrionii]|uniref:Uncharacterized protein n=1 Tax=Cladophialophora carrionii TaxID=86049 RepID=A0A1C1CW94_9EURO|nr:hypothetical protein CLCR_09503 [Cladophialophora carrionii]